MTTAPSEPAHALAELAFREERARVLATLIRLLGGDFDAAEEALADAFVAALETWPRDGVPANPGAWLTTTGRRKAIDRLRTSRRRADRLASLERDLLGAGSGEDRMHLGSDSALVDDRLRLVFTCCHPALPLEGRVALTLRTVGGLETPEIARAFLVPEATMAQRIVRAKRKIREAGIPYRVPPDDLLAERLDGVLATIYLIFNEGYAATAGSALVRTDLCAEAIRLARLVVELMTGAADAVGLLALLLLHDSRRGARTAADGSLVVLDEQDRTRWDRAEIDEGMRLVARAMALAPDRVPGPYVLQAAIAAEHARTVAGRATDWPAIAALYRVLVGVAPSPVHELNAAVAVAAADGPAAGLRLMDALVERGDLDGYYLLHAARADLLRRLDRPADAERAYRRALELATNETERRFLSGRLAEVSGAEP